MPHALHLECIEPLFQIANVLPSFLNLGIQALLDLRVRGLAHVVSGINENSLPLNLLVDLVDKIIVVIHIDGGMRDYAANVSQV